MELKDVPEWRCNTRCTSYHRQEIVLDAEAMEGSEGEAQGEAGPTSQASSFTKSYVRGKQ